MNNRRRKRKAQSYVRQYVQWLVLPLDTPHSVEADMRRESDEPQNLETTRYPLLRFELLSLLWFLYVFVLGRFSSDHGWWICNLMLFLADTAFTILYLVLYRKMVAHMRANFHTTILVIMLFKWIISGYFFYIALIH